LAKEETMLSLLITEACLAYCHSKGEAVPQWVLNELAAEYGQQADKRLTISNRMLTTQAKAKPAAAEKQNSSSGKTLSFQP
jgi:hypothetical protein